MVYDDASVSSDSEMRTCPLFVRTDPLGGILKLASDSPSAAHATTTLSIGLPSHGLPSLTALDDEYFVALVAVCPNLRVLHLRTWDFDAVRPHLLWRCSLSKLTSLSVGTGSTLTVAGLFGLLSMTPALKRLGIGRIESYYDSEGGSAVNDSEDEEYATPACSLTHLVVNDDWNINFTEYAHLLARSHDTLAHIELHWIYAPRVADAVIDALARCTRVRHLTLIGNHFAHARIIAACPGASSLALVVPPSDAEWAALRAPLRALELVNCYGERPEDFVGDAWERLRERLPGAPLLSRITFSMLRRPLLGETESVRQLREACKERRIHLSLRPGVSGLGS